MLLFSSDSRSCDGRQEVGFGAPGERNEGHFLPVFAAGLRPLLSPVRERPVAPSRNPAEGGGGVTDWIKTPLCLSRQRRSFRRECDLAARFSPLNGAMRRMHAWLWAAAGPALPGPASGCMGAMQLGETGCTSKRGKSTVGGVRLREESKYPH